MIRPLLLLMVAGMVGLAGCTASVGTMPKNKLGHTDDIRCLLCINGKDHEGHKGAGIVGW